MKVAMAWPRGWATAPAAAGDARPGERGVVAATRVVTASGEVVRASISVLADAGVDAVTPLVASQLDGEPSMLVRDVATVHATSARSFVPCDDDGSPSELTSVAYVVRCERGVVLARVDRAPRDAIGLAMVELDRAIATIRLVD